MQKGPDDIPGLKKPTLFKTNEFTAAFQLIVDTYGVPLYKEVNPAIFACVSFPFLFGVMFGDIYHGLLVLCFASYLCFSKENAEGITGAMRPIRYLLLLMGIFSFFNGLVYNDFASLSTQLFGPTCWSVAEKAEVASAAKYYATKDKDCVYPFGMDYTWYRASQEIVFMNSFKMKTSVIYGVSQMLLGTSMKGFNAFYFKRYGELVFDVFSQILLLSALFGFMDSLIIVKWTTDWDAVKAQTGTVPPGIVETMIVMFT